jgi:hypothetical protein
VREPASLCVHVENRHGHQFRQYQATLALLGHRVFALGDPAAPAPDVVVQMSFAARLRPDVPSVGSLHWNRGVDALSTDSPMGRAAAALFGHWLVKREVDAAALRERWGVEAVARSCYYPDLAYAEPPDPDRPVAYACASYINRYDEVGRGRGFELFQLVQERLGEACAWFGSNAPRGVVVDDVACFRRARFTLSLKHYGYICNAVVRSLCAGVPVVMDRRSFEIGRYEGFLPPRCGLVVLDSVSQIADFVQEVRGDGYATLSREAYEGAARFREPPRNLPVLDALLRSCAAAAADRCLTRPEARPSRARGSARTPRPGGAG